MSSQPASVPTIPEESFLKELVRSCQSGVESVGNELWEHLAQYSENYFRTRTARLCPEDMNLEGFVQACLYRAQRFFSKYLRTFEIDRDFLPWFHIYLTSRARDERRERTHQRAGDEKPGEKPISDFDDELLSVLREQGQRVLGKLEKEQRRKILLYALHKHASESPLNALSTKAIVLHFWEDLSTPKLSELFFDQAFATKRLIEPESQHQKMRRFLRKDIESIGKILANEFHITSSDGV